MKDIDSMTVGDFYRSYQAIAEQKETVGIKRFGNIDGYFVPAELYEELMQLHKLHSIKKREKN